MRIVFAICEGPHDTSFLAKLLKSKGYTSYTNPLSQFPEPTKSWYINIAKDLRIDDVKLDDIYGNITSLLPRNALVCEEFDQLVLLYSLGGDSQRDRRNKLLDILNLWTIRPKDEDDKAFSLTEELTDFGNNFSCLLFFDADEYGISGRIEKCKDELRERLFPLKEEIVNNGDIEEINDSLKIGIYVFADSISQKGNLENILLPLMKQGNESIFEDAESFITTHLNEDRLKPLVFKKDATGVIHEKRKGRAQFDRFKSLIGIVAQLQLSGFANTVCIEKSDYINLEKINHSVMCQEIINMFAKL